MLARILLSRLAVSAKRVKKSNVLYELKISIPP
jgi:hypothetical protein